MHSILWHTLVGPCILRSCYSEEVETRAISPVKSNSEFFGSLGAFSSAAVPQPYAASAQAAPGAVSRNRCSQVASKPWLHTCKGVQQFRSSTPEPSLYFTLKRPRHYRMLPKTRETPPEKLQDDLNTSMRP